LAHAGPQTEAQEFFKEAFPFPSAFTAIAVLAAGDFAIVVSMLLSLGYLGKRKAPRRWIAATRGFPPSEPSVGDIYRATINMAVVALAG
jgi:hypothetical protein